MAVSIARVPTGSASRYLQQLCKHWGHKYAVSFDAAHGEIGLPMGVCVLDAAEGELVVTLNPEPEADLDRFEQVVAAHLQRFAFREELRFDWSRAA